MKLVLANNQSQRFVDFYHNLQARSKIAFDYAGYDSLLFWFDSSAQERIEVIQLATNKSLKAYDGVYINSYLSVYELAATVAICCDYLKIGYVNHELKDPPSLSKLTMHAKLAAAGVPAPKTFAGSKQAIVAAAEIMKRLQFPAVLKRADADRGIDNFKVRDFREVGEILATHSSKSLWILQEFINNDGYYLVSFYDQTPAFSIFRTLETKPGRNPRKVHFYKPAGGSNASLVDLTDVPAAVLAACQAATIAMNRQIASVDCLYNTHTKQATVLEVNYNPQLVTIKTFQHIRQQAFLDNLDKIV